MSVIITPITPPTIVEEFMNSPLMWTFILLAILVTAFIMYNKFRLSDPIQTRWHDQRMSEREIRKVYRPTQTHSFFEIEKHSKTKINLKKRRE
jgi:hypothetical protein